MLADLFDGRSQLIVDHFMFGPEWKEGCKSCSFHADHFDGMTPHLNARDVSIAVVSRACNEKEATDVSCMFDNHRIDCRRYHLDRWPGRIGPEESSRPIRREEINPNTEQRRSRWIGQKS